MVPRVLVTEALKLKRTTALRCALLPLAIVFLYFLIGVLSGQALVRQGQDIWTSLTKNTVSLWTVLMLPLFITLETSLLAGLEHTDRNWKFLLTLPVPKWVIYLAKFVIAMGLVCVAHLVLIAGTMVSGMLLRQFAPALKLTALPIGLLVWPLAKISVAALLAVAIQHWVSLRWQSFTTAMAFGVCAMVIGFLAANSVEWGPWYPWSLTLHTLTPQPGAVISPMVFSVLAACVVMVLGAWQFTRREIG